MNSNQITHQGVRYRIKPYDQWGWGSWKPSKGNILDRIFEKVSDEDFLHFSKLTMITMAHFFGVPVPDLHTVYKPGRFDCEDFARAFVMIFIMHWHREDHAEFAPALYPIAIENDDKSKHAIVMRLPEVGLKFTEPQFNREIPAPETICELI